MQHTVDLNTTSSYYVQQARCKIQQTSIQLSHIMTNRLYAIYSRPQYNVLILCPTGCMQYKVDLNTTFSYYAQQALCNKQQTSIQRSHIMPNKFYATYSRPEYNVLILFPTNSMQHTVDLNTTFSYYAKDALCNIQQTSKRSHIMPYKLYATYSSPQNVLILLNKFYATYSKLQNNVLI